MIRRRRLKEFVSIGSILSVHTQRFGSGASAQTTSSHASSSLGEFGGTSETLSVHTHRSASGTSTQTTSSHVSSSYNQASSSSEQHLTADWSTTSATLFSAPTSVNASRVTISQGATSSGSTFAFPTPSCATASSPPAPARGMTPFQELKDHAVIWQHTLSTTLKFDIERDTLGLLPNPLKLVVMQRVIPDDLDGNPSNPRLGAVYLNLAGYVGQGSVERRYLLRESKTNATLKVMFSPLVFSKKKKTNCRELVNDRIGTHWR